ncbi:exported hypothetical protein [Nostocoides jenkinsii Ben 74]|uniref:Uncharacterized protein n=1 Tax=Nostocoides jenkinsii Ben 74 TaxID=1193518 RepID=A0A077MAJ4_9MICO|nr:exported hypothetical protein [Tetrasphaera jenkinsii Ben 74]
MSWTSRDRWSRSRATRPASSEPSTQSTRRPRAFPTTLAPACGSSPATAVPAGATTNSWSPPWGSAKDSGSQRVALTQAVNSIGTLMRGDTGLYDTIAAAFESARKNYIDNTQNLVIVRARPHRHAGARHHGERPQPRRPPDGLRLGSVDRRHHWQLRRQNRLRRPRGTGPPKGSG